MTAKNDKPFAELIDRVYEAAVLPDRWPNVLQDIADSVGAFGATINLVGETVRIMASPRMAPIVDEYVSNEWTGNEARIQDLHAEQYPGFRAETAYRTVEEIERLPIYVDFLKPRGLHAACATVIQGASQDAMHVAIEGFSTHPAAERALPTLDLFRPHLARSLSLTSLQSQRSQIIVDSIALSGAAAAIVDREGRLRSANHLFAQRLGNLMFEGRSALRFTDRFLQEQFVGAIERHRADQGQVQSIAVRDPANGDTFVIHILPIRGAAREICNADGIRLLVADGANAVIPDADLLRLLFDLTAAEARLTRALLEGANMAEASTRLGISAMTARVHLRSIFAKTGAHRQAELVRLLTGLGPPR